MKKTVTRYKCLIGPPWIAAVECSGDWPDGVDAQGERVYENTHFLRERDAWTRSLANARAEQEHLSGEYRRAQARLQATTEKLAGAAADRTEAESAFEKWKESVG